MNKGRDPDPARANLIRAVAVLPRRGAPLEKDEGTGAMRLGVYMKESNCHYSTGKNRDQEASGPNRKIPDSESGDPVSPACLASN